MMKLTIVLMMALSSRVAAAACNGQDCAVPDDETSLLQVMADVSVHADEASRGNRSQEYGRAGKGGGPPSFGPGTCGAETVPCQACIEEQWEQGNGAGFACCSGASKTDIMQQPLCGVCLRHQKGALGRGGAAPFNDECAAAYCAAADGVSPSLLQRIASACDPHKLGVFKTGQDPKGMIAIIANNPRKAELNEFLAANKKALQRYTQHVTGTASSSKMCMLTTGAQGAAATTQSGPFGGDAELGGILCRDAVSGAEEPAIDGLIFLNDENEAHQLDIKALKNIVEATMPAKKYALQTSQAKTVLKCLGITNGKC